MIEATPNFANSKASWYALAWTPVKLRPRFGKGAWLCGFSSGFRLKDELGAIMGALGNEVFDLGVWVKSEVLPGAKSETILECALLIILDVESK